MPPMSAAPALLAEAALVRKGDKLVLNGVNEAIYDQFFTAAQSDVDGDGSPDLDPMITVHQLWEPIEEDAWFLERQGAEELEALFAARGREVGAVAVMPRPARRSARVDAHRAPRRRRGRPLRGLTWTTRCRSRYACMNSCLPRRSRVAGNCWMN